MAKSRHQRHYDVARQNLAIIHRTRPSSTLALLILDVTLLLALLSHPLHIGKLTHETVQGCRGLSIRPTSQTTVYILSV